MMPDDERRTAYACDITYGTNSEFGFDYLRDNMAVDRRSTRCSAGTAFAIVDEVDSILIDEARTPLIISGRAEQAAETYYAFAKAVRDLVPGEDYEVDEKRQHRLPRPRRASRRSSVSSASRTCTRPRTGSSSTT